MRGVVKVIVLALPLLLAGCGNGGQGAPGADRKAQATASAVSAPDPRILALPAPYNAADYQRGRTAWRNNRCATCHTYVAGGPNMTGPNLHGMFGREVGAVSGFNYSPALVEADFTWDPAKLEEWLTNPQAFLKGNRMAMEGIPDATVRRDLIAFLMVETATPAAP